MSRSKRARAKKRHARPQAPAPKVVEARLRPDTEPTRVGSARRRAHTAKIGVGAAAAVSVGVTIGLSRASYAGHPKHHAQALSIPQPLYLVVRRNLLQAGILAPATAPPDATTSTS